MMMTKLKRANSCGLLLGLALIASALTGCGSSDPYGYDYNTGGGEILFEDDAKSNAEVDTDISTLEFLDINGKTTRLKDYIGNGPIVLVVTRGYAGSICLYCSTQTSRLISNYSEFKQRGAQVLVVFPVEKDDQKGRLDDFLTDARAKLDSPPEELPFPVVLDIELAITNKLGLRGNLAKPATYVLDDQGQVRFAYVGSSIADRPSVRAVLDQLDALEGS